MIKNIVDSIRLHTFKKCANLLNNAYKDIVDEITIFVLNANDQAVILDYLSNIATSDSFDTLHSSLIFAINIVLKQKNFNARSIGYLLIFYYLKVKLEMKSLYVYKLFEVNTIVCKYCGSRTPINIIYKHSIICHNCGNAIKEN